MVEGFRITIKGSEVQEALGRRIAELEKVISQQQSDLSLPQVDRTSTNALISKQTIEQQIQIHQAEIETLRVFRDRIVTTEEYLMDRDELRQAHIVPDAPAAL